MGSGRTQLSAQSSELDSAVRSRFAVKDSFQLPEGEMEYRVEYRADSGESFERLNVELGALGFTPRMTGTRDDAILLVRKSQAPHPPKSRIPVMLALLTLASVVAFGLLEQVSYHQFAPGAPGNLVFLLYGATVVAIFAAHEIGHRYVARRSGASPPTSYFVPGIPGLTAALPALGVVARQKEPIVNRDRFFDVMIVGPLLGLAASVVIYLAGGFVTFQSSTPLQVCQVVNPYISFCPTSASGIQSALDFVLAPFTPGAASSLGRLSPLQDGALVGFLLTFIGVLPMASFDGGHLSNLTLGPKITRAATYVCVFALISLDIPNYWALAIVVLLVAGRPAEVKVLDEISEVSRGKRWLYLGALILGLLSLPMPHYFANFPLS